MDSYLFRLRVNEEGYIAYSKEYSTRFKGTNKQTIIKKLRGEFGKGHCRVRRRKLIYTKMNITKNKSEYKEN